MVTAHTGCLRHTLCSTGSGQWLVGTNGMLLLLFVQHLLGADFLSIAWFVMHVLGGGYCTLVVKLLWDTSKCALYCTYYNS